MGSHLIEMLLSEDYQVKALSYYSSFNDCGWPNGIHHLNLEIVIGNVREPYLCKHISKDVEIIFHLADLKGQYGKIKEEINAGVQKVLDATTFINGQKIKEFEGHLADDCGLNTLFLVGTGRMRYKLH